MSVLFGPAPPRPTLEYTPRRQCLNFPSLRLLGIHRTVVQPDGCKTADCKNVVSQGKRHHILFSVQIKGTFLQVLAGELKIKAKESLVFLLAVE